MTRCPYCGSTIVAIESVLPGGESCRCGKCGAFWGYNDGTGVMPDNLPPDLFESSDETKPPMLDQSRLEKLEAVVRDLAAWEPLSCLRTAGLQPIRCLFCGRYFDYQAMDMIHAPDCPWLGAKKLMEDKQ